MRHPIAFRWKELFINLVQNFLFTLLKQDKQRLPIWKVGSRLVIGLNFRYRT
jgi:hypothetical protein